ncbi:MAG: hypothetical protein K9M49_08400 [Candidatus Marinimicrobia bacterium]|nr:hypothetical protein [Candidatus Neomarinimicrobiota bacterium]MCF7850700.1 hypothetical protein [Candidatus Neomarinimicrobiota bacterium]MCF7905156.1 hypothetical protein [Candidatus Neomarinimicrobiota bacterium]
MRTLWILILTAVSCYGQLSHADLTRDLLQDLKEAVADSHNAHPDSLFMTMPAAGASSAFVQQQMLRLQGNMEGGAFDSVQVELIDLALSINKNPQQINRNSAYIRQLKLSVNYMIGDELNIWTQSLTDRISSAELGLLLEDQFPGTIQGNYLEVQPSSLKIILLSVTTLALAAALYFIRT